MCTNHHQQLFLPKPALLTRQRAHGAASPGTGDGSRAYPAVSLSGVGLELEKHPRTHTHLLPHSLAQPQPAPCCLSRSSLSGICCRDTPRCPGWVWDSQSSLGTHGRAGWEQVERPGLAARARAPGGHSSFVCLCTVWEALPAWHQKVCAFKKTIVCTLCFWKNKG